MFQREMVAAITDKRQRRAAAREMRERDRARQARKAWIRRWGRRAALLVVVVGVVGGTGWWIVRPKPGTYVPSQGNAHISDEATGFRYASDPPTSGPHLAGAARWGVLDQPIAKALQVHNLEDGGVLVQYNCTDCDDTISRLRDLVRRYSDKVILAPYPGMKPRIALTAWAYIDTMDEFDEQRVLRFIEAHRGVDHHAGNRFGI